jgi:DNA-binding transcriptional MerR regulator
MKQSTQTQKLQTIPVSAYADTRKPQRKPVEEFFLIGDLAKEFNVTLRTLRFYEDRGLLAPKREGLTRIYNTKDHARLSLIMKGKHLGFTLSEIRTMIAAEEKGETPSYDLKLDASKVEEQIIHLENQKRDIETALDDLKQRRLAIAGGH